MIGADLSLVRQADSVAAERNHDAVERIHLRGRDKLRLLRERWSEFLSLLTVDFWLTFTIIFLHLTALTMMVILILFSGR